MQIFKCIKSMDFLNKRTNLENQSKVIKSKSHQKFGQNLIEFAFVLPTLIFLTLGIFEVALFWQDLNMVYNLNTEINANAALTDTSLMSLGSPCVGAVRGAELLTARNSSAGGYSATIKDGEEPFALYEYTASNSVGGRPQSTLWVDCRNPFENGITTQIEFYHKTIVMKATIPRFDGGDPIVIIPDNVRIASPKLNTIRHY